MSAEAHHNPTNSAGYWRWTAALLTWTMNVLESDSESLPGPEPEGDFIMRRINVSAVLTLAILGFLTAEKASADYYHSRYPGVGSYGGSIPPHSFNFVGPYFQGDGEHLLFTPGYLQGPNVPPIVTYYPPLPQRGSFGSPPYGPQAVLPYLTSPNVAPSVSNYTPPYYRAPALSTSYTGAANYYAPATLYTGNPYAPGGSLWSPSGGAYLEVR
jgi:hypothetical protein